MVDHVHMLIAIPPKYAVSQVIGYIKVSVRPSHLEVAARGGKDRVHVT